MVVSFLKKYRVALQEDYANAQHNEAMTAILLLRCSFPIPRRWPCRWSDHRQCDARPTAISSHRASPPIDQYQIILPHSKRNTRLWTSCPELLHSRTLTESIIQDLMSTRPLPNLLREYSSMKKVCEITSTGAHCGRYSRVSEQYCTRHRGIRCHLALL